MGLPLTKVLQMATDWTCPLTAYVYSDGRWHLSVNLRKMSSSGPDLHIELGVMELSHSLCFVFLIH